MFRSFLMTSEPSTSSGTLDADCNTLIQEALAQAGLIKIERRSVSPTNIKVTKNSLLAEKISAHPLMPVVELLLRKCETAATTFDKSVFEVDDIKQVSDWKIFIDYFELKKK
ncbi:hypothetical protein L5515_019103 [Caenorhabditis briggsae]|uniref:MEIS N-terminal domain-containing protein n=1 Tax=Caenorhabditis briggsae TaxID=6238 RepID=A0AAE9JV25_CAEBR|nr:hypothetical protein L5515_019103 [Caenorhabditis briggsae]